MFPLASVDRALADLEENMTLYLNLTWTPADKFKVYCLFDWADSVSKLGLEVPLAVLVYQLAEIGLCESIR